MASCAARDVRGVAAAIVVAVAASLAQAAEDALEQPLVSHGDIARGREIFLARDGGHCVLCHAAPGVSVAGNVGPSLAGVGSRLTSAQIRLRIVDITRVN